MATGGEVHRDLQSRCSSLKTLGILPQSSPELAPRSPCFNIGSGVDETPEVAGVPWHFQPAA